MPKTVHWLISLLIVLFCTFVYWVNFPLFQRLELVFQDTHFKLRGPVLPDGRVVIAAIDEKSLDELGRWPWSRNIMARLVDKLVELDAGVIGFDVLFSSPENSLDSQYRDEIERSLLENGTEIRVIEETFENLSNRFNPDAKFAEALHHSKRAVLGYFFHHNVEDIKTLSQKTQDQNFEHILSSRFKGFMKSDATIDLEGLLFRQVYGVESNISAISKKIKSAGFLSFDAELDGSVQKLPLVVRYRHERKNQSYFFPPLAVRILEKYLEGTLLFKVNPIGVENVLLDSEEPIEIQVDNQGAMILNYLGPQGRFPYYSITDILNGQINLTKENYFQDKVVLVGATAKGLKDVRKTPFDPVMPGVEIHATIIDNILRQRFIYQPDWTSLVNGVCMVLLGIFFTLLYSKIRPIYSPVIWLGVVVLLFAVNHLVFTQKNFWISNVFPQMEHLLVFGSLIVYRYVIEEKHKRYIKNIFGQYVSPTVINRLLENQDKLKLGGEEKELTAFFTDIAGFSTISERLSPMEIVSLLNEYLSEMTDILLKYDGTLDKYDGDAIKAFFGAPIYFPDHAKRACCVATEMQERLNELRIHWKQKGIPEIYMRIGINTGSMVIGNFGSKRRMNYGMNGDAVNIAARLEGANKEYGTFSMISQSTYDQAKEFIEVRELDCIKVVGREDAVKVYELLGKKDLLRNSIREILPYYNQGLQHYKDQCWDKSVECFRKAIEVDPKDGPSLTYLNRCEHFKKFPPNNKWNGIFTLTKK